MSGIEELTSILNADRAEWDAFVGDGVFWRQSWLATAQQCSILPMRSRYFVARGTSGMRAAAVCSLPAPGDLAAAIDRILSGRFAPLARALQLHSSPMLVCGSPVGLACNVRVRADLSGAERAKSVDAMVGVLQEAARAKRQTRLFRNVKEEDVLLHAALRRRGFRQKPLCMYLRSHDRLRRSLLRPTAAARAARVRAMVGEHDPAPPPSREKTSS